jgi:hypothetical protein
MGVTDRAGPGAEGVAAPDSARRQGTTAAVGASADPVVGLLRLQRQHLAAASPLYAAVLDAVIADVVAGGACRAVLEPHRDDPFGSALGLRFLGAVHRLVLAGRAPGLAAHYPTMGGRPGDPVEVGAAFVAAVAGHAEEIGRGVRVPVQTNEPGRSASLLGGFLAVARATRLPLRVLELGASAGLNLRWDHFGYEGGGQRFGPVDSPLQFRDPFAGLGPDLSVTAPVAERRGCDPNPIDPSGTEGRALLRSFVWPDQLHRLERLDAAIAVAAAVPVVIDRARAGPWLDDRLARPVPGTATVVVHSVMMQYLTAAERQQVRARLARAGDRAAPRAPLAWLRMEPGGPVAEVRLTTWPGGRTRLLATSTFHGPPVTWRAGVAG